jgi:hypothetical protein
MAIYPAKVSKIVVLKPDSNRGLSVEMPADMSNEEILDLLTELRNAFIESLKKKVEEVAVESEKETTEKVEFIKS